MKGEEGKRQHERIRSSSDWPRGLSGHGHLHSASADDKDQRQHPVKLRASASSQLARPHLFTDRSRCIVIPLDKAEAAPFDLVSIPAKSFPREFENVSFLHGAKWEHCLEGSSHYERRSSPTRHPLGKALCPTLTCSTPTLSPVSSDRSISNP